MVHRLEDLSYRVEVLNDSRKLAALALRVKPMVVLVDLDSRDHDVASAISKLRCEAETSHIPVLAFTESEDEAGQEAARTAGADMVASGKAILDQLPSLLDHVLEF